MTTEGKAVSVIVGLGSNLGDRDANIARALELVGEIRGVRVLGVSSLRETEPVGGPPQGLYLNAAAELETTLPPRDLLLRLQEIEAALGRVRSVRDGPRPIELDILLYGAQTIDEPGLEVPHPRMLERAFVLEPLAELAPGRRHPLTGTTAWEHWSACRSALGASPDRKEID